MEKETKYEDDEDDTIVEVSIAVASDGWTLRARRQDGRWLCYQQPIRQFGSAAAMAGQVMLGKLGSLESSQWFYADERCPECGWPTEK